MPPSCVLASMWKTLVIAALLAADVQAFAPAPLRWEGANVNNFVLARRSAQRNALAPRRPSVLPEELMLWDEAARISPNEIIRFTAGIDNTISSADGLCLEAGDDANELVLINHCTGRPDQLWIFLPSGGGRRNQIKLLAAEKCIGIDDRDGGLNESPVKLRECASKMTDAWKLEEPIAIWTQPPSQTSAMSSFRRTMIIFVSALGGLGALRVSAWLWQWRSKVSSAMLGQSDVPLIVTQGEVHLPTALAVCQEGVQPAVMVIADKINEKTKVQTAVEEKIASNPVVIFCKSTCPWSTKAKDALQKVGLSCKMIELDKQDSDIAEEIQDHLMTMTGARTLPRVFVGHTCIGGGTDVLGLLEHGMLQSLAVGAMNKHRADLSGKDVSQMAKSEAEWQRELSPEVYHILRQRGTEYPGSHEYDQFYPKSGYFSCAGCSLPLYSASSKFESSCGWPVFDRCYHSKELGCHVGTRPDGTGALEIVCPRCGGHLGHVFFDAHSAQNRNGERH